MSIFLQVDSLAVANQVAAEAQPTEQTLSMEPNKQWRYRRTNHYDCFIYASFRCFIFIL